MAKKPLEQEIDALTSLVEKGFASVPEEIANLATKEQVIALHAQRLNCGIPNATSSSRELPTSRKKSSALRAGSSRRRPEPLRERTKRRRTGPRRPKPTT